METITSIWVVIGFFAVLAIGLFADIVIATVFWGKWRELFKTSLIKPPWGGGEVIRMCLLLILIFWMLYLFEYIIFKLGIFSKDGLRYFTTTVSTLGVYISGILVITNFLGRKHRDIWVSLGFRWRLWWKRSFTSFLFYIGFIPVLVFLTCVSIFICDFMDITPLPHPLISILKEEKDIGYILYLSVIAVLIAPWFEEIIFRGLIYQGLKKHIGIPTSMVISGILFSLLHFNVAQFLPVMGLGVLLCFIFEYAGSLVPSVVIHMLNNGIFLGLFLMLREYV